MVSRQNTMPTLQSSNRWATKQLVVMALMAAIALLLSFFEFPLFAAAPFLKLDFALVPSTIVGFAYGVGPGVVVGFVCAAGHAVITGNWVGCLMNCIVALVFIAPASLIYRKSYTFKSALIGFVVATLCLIVGIIIANLIIDPLFYGMPFEAVAALVIPVMLPFNVIKGICVSALTLLIYKSISGFIAPLEKTSKKASNE